MTMSEYSRGYGKVGGEKRMKHNLDGDTPLIPQYFLMKAGEVSADSRSPMTGHGPHE